MQQIKNSTLSVSIAFVILFSNCSITERARGIAYLRHYKSDSLEIEMPYAVKGRGSLHNFTFEKFKDSSSNWIYISKLERKVTSDRLILICTKGYLPQRNLKGEINIDDSILMVNFKIPRYNNKSVVKRWVNYEFNGTYKLKNGINN